MIGIEEAYCNVALDALLRANFALLESRIDDAVQDIHVWSKGDTLRLDAIPESTIAERLKRFDQYAILITEERGEDANPLAKSAPESARGPRTFFVSDPTDRTSQFKEFLVSYVNRLKRGKNSATVGSAIRRKSCEEQWEDRYDSPASISGAFSAITCVRRGIPICSVLLNYITQEVTVACSAGIFLGGIPESDEWQIDRVTVRTLITNGRPLHFRRAPSEPSGRFVTFMNKAGYPENFRASRLVPDDEIKDRLHYDTPGGPSRILYLSNIQPRHEAIGFIVANGEKIGEWIHWLPFIRFGRMESDAGEAALNVFEVFQDRPWTRDGILMSTAPAYSVFRRPVSFRDGYVIDVDRLQSVPNPSKYRSTLLVAPAGSDWAMHVVQRYGHRGIEFFG